MTTRITLSVPEALDGERADRVVARLLEGRGDDFPAGTPSRAEVQRWIADRRVVVAGRAVRGSERLRAGSTLEVFPAPPAPSSALPEDIALDVLYEDDELTVVNKPAGMVVHPAPGHPSGTLVNALLHRYGPSFATLGPSARIDAPSTQPIDEALRDDDEGEDDEEPAVFLRPGIVHRLDRGTSGVMVVARTPRARDHLARAFHAHDIERSYLAIAIGAIGGSITHDTLHARHPVDRKRFSAKVTRGKRAITVVDPLEPLRGATLVRCTLHTGRTHQIRVHLSESGHPLLGDATYGGHPRSGSLAAAANALGRPALHAAVLGFVHPDGRPLRFEVPPPDDFARALASLR